MYKSGITHSIIVTGKVSFCGRDWSGSKRGSRICALHVFVKFSGEVSRLHWHERVGSVPSPPTCSASS